MHGKFECSCLRLFAYHAAQGNLRRMVYLFLKEVAESTDATEVIIVVQSLCKDMNNSVDVYRSNSIRTLAKIVDVRASLMISFRGFIAALLLGFCNNNSLQET